MTTLLDIVAQWGPGPHGPHGPQGPMGPHWGTGGGMMPWGGTGAGGFGFVWSLLGLFVIVAILVGGMYLALRLLREPEQGAGADSALDVLRQRYARGDIDVDEFDERRARLVEESPP